MFLKDVAKEYPNKTALVLAGAEHEVTYFELNDRTIKAANLFIALGLTEGECIAVYLENSYQYMEICLGAIRAGLYFVPIAKHLKNDEVNYVLEDSKAKILIASDSTLSKINKTLPESIEQAFTIGRPTDFYSSWTQALLAQSSTETQRTHIGGPMFYSSGTTGRPKGIKNKLIANNEESSSSAPNGTNVNLVTGPLYHISSFNFAYLGLMSGGTSVIMEAFDAEWTLLLIEKYRVTHAHMVPTMFSRLLALGDESRRLYDLSTLSYIEHNSAPCPVHVKEQMINWLGPILYEIYGASEPAGCTFISSHEWLEHKGSVGRPIIGTIHVLDENKKELGPNQIGTIFFSGAVISFDYYNSPEKFKDHSTDSGWFSYGDIGYVDDDGYLYLKDRAANIIIVGGQNVYAQEVENLLIKHPSVFDAAVVGIPHEIYGQEVRAFVQLNSPTSSNTIAEEILSFCQQNISSVKCPKSIEIVHGLPRTENGKLIKRYLNLN